MAQELTRRTGVTLDVPIPASNDDESEMNKMIAANDLTDLIFFVKDVLIGALKG